ncbi:MAG: hypothetical protein KDD78_05210, partial [Caldilineaceae bacterium]|nr:hypothetical protein [Caldilineaceae bacterium]
MTAKKSGNAQRSGLGIGAIIIVVLLYVLLQSFGGGDDGVTTNPADAPVAVNAVRADVDAATAAENAPSGMPLITVDELPPEAVTTLLLIQAGGPFPYRQDGATFQNREGLLPRESNGYYAEYTVETPGSDDRGARRFVTGDQGEFYYTDDHYGSFAWLVLPATEADSWAGASNQDNAPDTSGQQDDLPAGMQQLPLDELPPQVADAVDLIAAGGPFAYSQDGGLFENREGLLPAQPTGYYAQYTVETPGIDGRGDRRMVVGKAGEAYYSNDRFASFVQIDLAGETLIPGSAAGSTTSETTSETMSESASASAPATSPSTTAADKRKADIAASAARAPQGMALIFLNELPPEAIDTLVLIANDGPFPYRQDGATFQNRERILPREPEGYYREYTVETPGSDDRGARRIVAGDGYEYYYTDDHYDS